MAEQNSITNYSSFLECPNVQIEGGIIDNVAIGNTTPADGSFLALNSASVALTGGLIDGIDIGSITIANGTFSTLNSASVDLTGGLINGVDIGTTTPAQGIFSNLGIESAFMFPVVDGAPNQVLTTNGTGTVSWQNPSDNLYEEVTVLNKAMQNDTAYGANNAAGVTFTLPATAPAGSVISVTGIDGIWTIHQNASQEIRVGDSVTTNGVLGSITADDVGDCIQLRCISSDTIWRVEYVFGALTLI